VSTVLPIEGTRSLRGPNLGFMLDAPVGARSLSLSLRAYVESFETPETVEILLRRGELVETHTIEMGAFATKGEEPSGYQIVYADRDVVLPVPAGASPDLLVSVRRGGSASPCGVLTYGGVTVDRVEVR
jgi:hypothetical protein